MNVSIFVSFLIVSAVVATVYVDAKPWRPPLDGKYSYTSAGIQKTPEAVKFSSSPSDGSLLKMINRGGGGDRSNGGGRPNWRDNREFSIRPTFPKDKFVHQVGNSKTVNIITAPQLSHECPEGMTRNAKGICVDMFTK